MDFLTLTPGTLFTYDDDDDDDADFMEFVSITKMDTPEFPNCYRMVYKQSFNTWGYLLIEDANIDTLEELNSLYREVTLEDRAKWL